YLPSVDLIAQYGLLARFNGYDEFFPRFQRNNGQVGVSLKVPLFPSSASIAMAAQATADITRLKTQVNQTRNRLTVNSQKAFRDVALQERARDVARLDLEVSRDQVSILLAQMEEGRASLRQLEESRFLEQEKWIAYFDTQYLLDRAKVELLNLT